MKVLLTGATGQLGRCIQDRFPNDWQLIALDSKELDITDNVKVDQYISEMKPDVVINAAAYTAVDKAETEVEQAFLVNATAVGYLAKACNAIGARLIHISTDYVFDGTSSIPYTTLDAPNPINVYGKSKLAGELLALAHNPLSQVIRTSWVYSEYGNNFVKTMIRLADEGRDAISVVDDQIGCPTYAGNLAQFIIELIQQPVDERLLHYSDGEVMSWCGFAEQVFSMRRQQGKSFCEVKPISTYEYSTLANRPKFSILQGSQARQERETVAQVIDLL
jgi:dTDP-4-dehydrorhamnose reductase